MSTDRYEIPEGLDEQLGRLGAEARRAPRDIGDEIDGQRRRQANVAYGAATLIQRGEDAIADLTEQLGQSVQIDQRAQSLLGTPPAPAAPAPGQPGNVPTQPDTPVVVPEPPAPAPPAPAPPAPVRQHPLDVRHWRPIQWVLAVILALLAYGVCRGIMNELDIDDTVLRTLFFIGATLVGFGLGGFLGTFVDDAWVRFRNRRNAAVTP